MNTENSIHFQFKEEDELRTFIAYNSYKEIEKYIDNLRRNLNSLYDKRNSINNAVNELKKHGIKCDQYSYDENMDYINEDIKPLKKHWDLIDKYLKEKQEHCDHDWIYDGRDSHYDYYKCSKCGKESKD